MFVNPRCVECERMAAKMSTLGPDQVTKRGQRQSLSPGRGPARSSSSQSVKSLGPVEHVSRFCAWNSSHYTRVGSGGGLTRVSWDLAYVEQETWHIDRTCLINESSAICTHTLFTLFDFTLESLVMRMVIPMFRHSVCVLMCVCVY